MIGGNEYYKLFEKNIITKTANILSQENMGLKYTYCQFHLRKVMLMIKTTKDFRIEKDYANLKVHIV